METMTETTATGAARSTVQEEVPPDRRQEILRYLRLFGYKPESTILQVHIAGFFRKGQGGGGRGRQRRAEAVKRYGGTTFVIVGRTHDPAVLDRLAKPKSRNANPGYVGYLWHGKAGVPPHELLPLDFVPSQMHYPDDWKKMFATKGMLVAMHVPAAFASKKNALARALYRAARGADTKKGWNALLDQVSALGYENVVLAAPSEGEEKEEGKRRTRVAQA